MVTIHPNLTDKGRVAFFWDESYIWGLLAYKTFSKLAINFDIITSDDIKKEGLDSYGTLFVPGGWAGDKSHALGIEGKERIRDFIKKGGSYLGCCGGAGLALDSADGLSVVPISRKPSIERIPNFSGQIKIVPSSIKHPIWKGLNEPIAFYAWWPGQFNLGKDEGIMVIARYGKPESDFFVSDLPVRDIENYGNAWDKWENSYGINLNPGRLEGEPAIIEGRYGRGKVVLSYLHLETPDDRQGNQALLNICAYLAGGQSGMGKGDSLKDSTLPLRPNSFAIDNKLINIVRELEIAGEKFISFGQRNFLWFWRNSWLLQWRRGIRGLEYGMIYLMIKELSRMITEMVKMRKTTPESKNDIGETPTKKMVFLKEICLSFFEEAKQLLMEERYAMNYGSINFGKSDDHKIQQLREKLFSSSKRYGGDFKQIIAILDNLLLGMIRCRHSA